MVDVSSIGDRLLRLGKGEMIAVAKLLVVPQRYPLLLTTGVLRQPENNCPRHRPWTGYVGYQLVPAEILPTPL